MGFFFWGGMFFGFLVVFFLFCFWEGLFWCGLFVFFFTSVVPEVLRGFMYLIFQNLCKGTSRKKQFSVHPAGFSWETFTPVFSIFPSSIFLITEERSKY